jgi:hypothetical protein
LKKKNQVDYASWDVTACRLVDIVDISEKPATSISSEMEVPVIKTWNVRLEHEEIWKPEKDGNY